MTIQAVQISNTFNEFRETTNLVIDEVNKLGDGTGNLVINTITANTFVGVSSDLNIVSDTGNDVVSLTTDSLVFSGTNGISTNISSGSNTVNVNLTTTGVSSGVYGSSNQIPVFNVNSQGRITAASNVSISTTMTIAGNTGNDVISFSTETLRIVGSNGISTSVSSGSNTVTINFDNISTDSAYGNWYTFRNPNFYNTQENDYYSWESTLTDDYIIIAAKGEDTYGEENSTWPYAGYTRGIIYIYDAKTKNLIRHIDSVVYSKVTYNTPDNLGRGIYARGDYLFVPVISPRPDVNTIYNPYISGVYVYQISTGKLLHILKSHDKYTDLNIYNNYYSYSDPLGEAYDYRAMSIYEDKVAISTTSPLSPIGDARGGYISVYEYKTGNLIYTRENPNANTTSVQPWDDFGTTIDMYGDYIICGAPYEDANTSTGGFVGNRSGYAYVINYKTDTILYTVKNPEAANGVTNNHYFGKGTAIGKNYFAVYSDANSGTLRVFRLSDGSIMRTFTGIGTSYVKPFIRDNYLIFGGVNSTIWDLENDVLFRTTGPVPIDPDTGYSIFGYIADTTSKYILYKNTAKTSDEYPLFNYGEAYLYQWRDTKKQSIEKLTDVVSIEFASGRTLDKNTQIFNLPNIELKYAPTEMVHNIVTPENIVGNEFGKRTAITNKYFIASSDSTANTGNVHVYDLKSGALRYFLTNPNPVGTTANDFFGSSLAADDTYLAVGSFEDDTANTDSGKVYVYQIDTGGLLYTLNNPTANGTSANDFFGSSGLALSNNVIAVGAHREANSIFSNTGIVYVYSIPTFASNIINVPTRIIYNPEPANNDFFGYSVCLDEQFLLVGAYNKTVGANTGAGKAYLFNANTGALLKTHTAPTANANDYFGFSTTIHGDYYAIGAYNKNNGANTAVGTTYVYRTKHYANTAIHTLTNPNLYNNEANDQFGYSVSLNNGKLAVSALGEDYDTYFNAGVIYLYDVNFTNANLVNIIYSPSSNVSGTVDGPQANDEFGFYIASNRNYIVTTGRSEDSGNTDAGRIYVYATRPVRDMQIPELSQVERITLADGTQITPTTVVTTSNINKYASGSYLYLSSNFGGF